MTVELYSFTSGFNDESKSFTMTVDKIFDYTFNIKIVFMDNGKIISNNNEMINVSDKKKVKKTLNKFIKSINKSTYKYDELPIVEDIMNKIYPKNHVNN